MVFLSLLKEGFSAAEDISADDKIIANDEFGTSWIIVYSNHFSTPEFNNIWGEGIFLGLTCSEVVNAYMLNCHCT
jgi:hypothetical protein